MSVQYIFFLAVLYFMCFTLFTLVDNVAFPTDYLRAHVYLYEHPLFTLSPASGSLITQ